MVEGSRICSCRCVPDRVCGAGAEQAPAEAWKGGWCVFWLFCMCVFVGTLWARGQDMQQDIPMQATHTCIEV